MRTWRAHAELLTGDYTMSRGFFTTFVDFSNLIGQIHVGLDADGRPSVPDIFGRPPCELIEVAPFQWQDAYGHDRLAGEVKDGKVVRWSIDAASPVMVWLPVPWYRNAAWLMPALLISSGIVALSAIGWLAVTIDRRRYGVSLGLSGGDLILHRLVHGSSCLALALFAGWLQILTSLGRGWSTLRAVATIPVLWAAVAFHLVSFGAHF